MKKILLAISTAACAVASLADVKPLLLSGNRYVQEDAVKLVYQADAAVDAAWTACRTPASLKAHQQKVRERLIAALGGFPERTALNGQTVGRVARDGYAVEKVMFESRPHHHVTANLFLPDPVKFPGKRPGIVIPCGHSLNGKGCNPYQRGAVKAAKLGLVAMVYDPIDQGERRQSRGNAAIWCCSAHNNVGYRAELLGWNTATFRIWDGMRALDYLETRPEVDASRLGVMGHSGGGTMTSWIMCLDERIRSAAPSGFLTTIRALCSEQGPQDAEQNVFGQLAFGFNHLGHVVLRAPSPVLLCSSHGDFFPFVGVLDTAANARKVYATLGAEDAFRLSDTIGPHAWHESTSSYAADWMNHVFQGAPLAKTMEDYREQQYGFSFGAVDTALAYEADSLADMRTNRREASVTPTGSTLDLPGERTVYDIMSEEAAHQLAERPALTPAAVRRLAGIRDAKKIGYKVRAAATRDGVETAVLVMDDGTPVPVRTFGEGARVLYVTDTEKLADAEKEARAIAATGCRVTWADLRGFGETAAGRHRFYGVPSGDEEICRLYALVGVNLVAKRAEDAIAAARYVGDGKPVRLVARGRAAVAAAHAGYVAGKKVFAAVEVQEPSCAWADLFKDDAKPYRFAEVVNGAWKLYDWVDLLAGTK